MLKPYHFFPFAAALLAGCGMQSAEETAVAKMSQCEKVMALVDAHPGKFENIRKNLQSTRKITVWDARYHLVGKNCQVWAWGSGKTDYMCSLTAPNKETAQESFNKAKDLTQSCLGSNWQLSEAPRKVGNGIKATFTRPNSDTVVALHAVETRGVIKDEWTTYFFVGDASDEL
ncbi:hypothetical protein [Pseudomaricurvus sp.]|uniref:hypothetical protein n=1 Tax=Pseudomaricurvus sp. TaxID=2004510 RepID=UPI003F6C2C32